MSAAPVGQLAVVVIGAAAAGGPSADAAGRWAAGSVPVTTAVPPLSLIHI
ncbi:hypothetical protein [Arthrobacter sp. KBS0703]|nr:hypothetical protein [Arthrobacter sp. KBS0703]